MRKYFTFLISLLLTIPLISQTERKVIVEHFTNSRCSTCAAKNPAFYQTLEDYPNVLHVAYHPSSPYPTCIFNQYNKTENDNRAYFYGVYGGTPRAVVQGNVIPVQTPLLKAEQIDAETGEGSDYEISITKTEQGGNNYKITLEIKRVAGIGYESVLVYAGLAEKEIEYSAPNGENLHHDVFRRVIYFDTISTNSINQVRTIEYEYGTDAVWVESQIYAYAIIHNAQTFEIKQSGSSLESPSGISNSKVNELSNVFYPNPSSGIVKIRNEYRNTFVNLELFDLVGNKVKEYIFADEINISELPEGFYFVRLTDTKKQVYSSRIIKTN